MVYVCINNALTFHTVTTACSSNAAVTTVAEAAIMSYLKTAIIASSSLTIFFYLSLSTSLSCNKCRKHVTHILIMT